MLNRNSSATYGCNLKSIGFAILCGEAPYTPVFYADKPASLWQPTCTEEMYWVGLPEWIGWHAKNPRKVNCVNGEDVPMYYDYSGHEAQCGGKDAAMDDLLRFLLA